MGSTVTDSSVAGCVTKATGIYQTARTRRCCHRAMGEPKKVGGLVRCPMTYENIMVYNGLRLHV